MPKKPIRRRLRLKRKTAQTENRLYLPLVSAPYQGAIVLLPGDGVYYEHDQDVQIVHVVGEVLNNTSTPVSKVMIEATLNLKSGGSTSLRGFPLAGSLAPGARACFDLYLVEQKQVENYAVKVLSMPPAAMCRRVEISARELPYPQNGWYRVADGHQRRPAAFGGPQRGGHAFRWIRQGFGLRAELRAPADRRSRCARRF